MPNDDSPEHCIPALQDVVQAELRGIEFELDRLQKRRETLSAINQAVLETAEVVTSKTPLNFYPVIVLQGGRARSKPRQAQPHKLRIVAG